jgi:predicted phosphoribosyltransferase
MLFADRSAAGARLAQSLEHLREESPIVLGLPRGGVPVAREVAVSLGAPLDVIVTRKLGAPGNSEYAVGAIGEGGVRVVDEHAILSLGVTNAQLTEIERRERAELNRRAERFRLPRAPLDLTNRTVVIVDDGIATGSTAAAACRVARVLGASRIVLAVPVAPPDWAAALGDAADEYVALETPRGFFAVGQWYADFTQTTDEEVLEHLASIPPQGG